MLGEQFEVRCADCSVAGAQVDGRACLEVRDRLRIDATYGGMNVHRLGDERDAGAQQSQRSCIHVAGDATARAVLRHTKVAARRWCSAVTSGRPIGLANDRSEAQFTGHVVETEDLLLWFSIREGFHPSPPFPAIGATDLENEIVLAGDERRPVEREGLSGSPGRPPEHLVFHDLAMSRGDESTDGFRGHGADLRRLLVFGLITFCFGNSNSDPCRRDTAEGILPLFANG